MDSFEMPSAPSDTRSRLKELEDNMKSVILRTDLMIKTLNDLVEFVSENVEVECDD